MKILISSVVDLKKSNHNRIHQIIRHLKKNNDITVISIADYWKDKQSDVGALKDIYDTLCGEDLKYIQVTKARIPAYMQEMFGSLMVSKQLKEVLDGVAIYVNYNNLLLGQYFEKIMFKRNIPIVLDIADDLPEMVLTNPHIPRPLRKIGYRIAGMTLKTNIKLATKTTVITDLLARKYLFNTDHSNVVIVPNGVDINLFTPKKDLDLAYKIGIATTFNLGYVGVLREWIDFEPIFSAMNNLKEIIPNIRMLIVGEEGGIAWVNSIVNKYGLQGKVIFTGNVPYSQVPKYINMMDICFVARKLNNVAHQMLPLKIFEYLSCGKPVISTNTKAVYSSLGNMLLYADDSEQYTNAIKMLYLNPNIREDMGRRGRAFVCSKYSWDIVGNQFESVLYDTISEVKSKKPL